MKTNMKKIVSCIVCGSSDFKVLYLSKDRMFDLPGEFCVKQCRRCSLSFLDPQPGQELLKKYYPSKRYYSYSKSRKKGLFEILREYLIHHYYSPNVLSLFISTFIQDVPAMPSYVEGGKILDIGCGVGDTLFLLKNLGWNTYGIDMDKRAIETAKKRGLTNIRLGTYTYLSKYPDNYFDAIRLYHVIEHLDNPSLCLQFIYKKLKKNGELVMGTPNSKSIVSSIFKTYWYNLDSPRHLFIFSPKTLGKLLHKNGFRVQKVNFCSAGGIAGSLQYLVNESNDKKIDLIHNLYGILLLYPFEWLLNKLGNGDVFVVRAAKTS